MASNKFDTEFEKIEAKNLKLTYTTFLGTTTVEGTPRQLVNHLLEL